MRGGRRTQPSADRTTEAVITGEPTAELIQEELAAEREARRSLEQRALSLFASAGVIGSLAGIAGRGVALPVATKVLLGLALVALVAGAGLGLWVAYPDLVEEVIDPDGLRAALEPDEWKQSADKHLIRASEARIRVAENTRKTNENKACRLQIGVWCAGVGIVLLLAAVIVALAA